MLPKEHLFVNSFWKKFVELVEMAKAIRRSTLAFFLIAEARGFLARKDIKTVS
jgi:hypothetical protein